MKPRIIAATVLLVLSSGAAASQRVNDASIQGMVLRDGTNQPVEGVTVNAYLGDEFEKPAETATTNGTGTFVITGLRSEVSYSLKFSREGYVSQFFGQAHLGGMFFVDEVQATRSRPNLVMRLIPTGSIRGRVQDTAGKGMSGIPVGLLSNSYGVEGERTFYPAGEKVLTDEHGEFQVSDVEPGKYIVFAGGNPQSFGIRNEPALYSVAYYPNSPSPAAGKSVEVRPSADTTGIDFTMTNQSLYQVRGRIIEEETGRPPSSASVFADSPDLMSPIFFRNGSSYDGVDGTFEIRLAPGEHTIGAQVIGSPCLAARGAVQADGMVTSVISAGSTRVQIREADLNGIIVPLRKTRCISGDVRAEEGNVHIDWMHFYARTTDKQMQSYVSVRQNGKFELDGLLPNEYRLSRIILPEGSYLKEAKFGEIDILNGSFRVDSATSAKMQLVLSSRVAQIEGVVTDSSGRVAPRAIVVLVPDKLRDRHELYQAAVTDERGHFLLKSIAPGDYKAFAWDSIEERSWLDADVVRRYEQHGRPIRVQESSRENVGLLLITAP